MASTNLILEEGAAGRVKGTCIVDLFCGFDKLMDGLRVAPDDKPWYG